MPDNKYPVEMISGVPVMTAPAEIDVTAAEQLRAVLLEWAGHGHATVVVDMTRTQFCDSSGPGVLVRAHKRALEEGGGLRLVIPPVGTVFRSRAGRPCSRSRGRPTASQGQRTE